MPKPSLLTAPVSTPYPEWDEDPTAQWQAVRVALWLGRQHPDRPVRLVRSPAEQVRACFVGPAGSRVQLLLTFDWPAGVPALVTAASLADAIRTSSGDDEGGLSLGVPALVPAADGEAPGPLDDDPTAHLDKHLTQQRWAALVAECHQVWQDWDELPLPEPGPLARHYRLAPQVVLALGQLYPLGREEPGELITVAQGGQTIIAGQFFVVAPPPP